MIGEYIQKALEKVRKSAIFLLAGLVFFVVMGLGMTETAWAAVETVKTFGLVEKEGIMEPLSGGNGTANTPKVGDDVQIVSVGSSVSPGDIIVGPGANEILDTTPSPDDVLVGGPFTESDTFNDGSVVYVRVNMGTYHKDSSNVTVIDDADGANQITITVYDNGYLPDEDKNNTYHWGKFILQQGPGPSSGTTLQLSNDETATISANLDVGDAGTTNITADYDDGSGEASPVDHSDHIPPVMNLSINPGTFSPDGDGVQDTAVISFTLYDNVSSLLYTRVEIRDSSTNIIKRNLLIPSSADNPLSTGSHSYIWDGKDDNGNYVPDAIYVVYLLSVDDAENSAQRTAEVIVETTEPEILDVAAIPPTISPQNGDGSYDTSTITFTATNAGEELNFKIYSDPDCPETALVRNLTSSVQLVGGVDHYSVTWNGKDDAGSYVDDGTYTCQIYAKSLAGEDEENTEGTVTIDNTAPSAPTDLSAAAVSGGGIKLTWTASSSGDAAQYNIYRATTSEGQNYTNPTYTVSVGTNTYTDTSTSDGVTYYYVVRTEDSLGNIETNTDEVSTMASASGPSFSSITADKSAYKNGETITLTVTLANHDTGCTFTADFSNIDDQYLTGGEIVENWGTDTRDNDEDGHTDNPGEQGIYVITYLISMVNSRTDSSYNIPVTATNAAENSTTSSISLTLDNIPLSAPTDLTATPLVDGSIQLTWTASSSSDISQYNIYRATTSGGEDYTSPTYTVLVGTNSYTDTSTTAEVIYYYVVRAQDSAGNIETNTNEVSATAGIPDTTAPPPPYFGISSFDSTTGKIVISGTTGADASQPQEVEIFLNGSSQGTTVADANGDFTTENFTPGIILVSGHNFITVQATDKVGNKGSLSAPLKLNYKPQNLLSIVIRSTHVVSSGSSTKPIKVFYSVSQSALVTICIYNLKGELVKEWSQSVTPGGEPSWSWFGKNIYEENVNNGVYILRITARAGSESETVTKLVGVLR